VLRVKAVPQVKFSRLQSNILRKKINFQFVLFDTASINIDAPEKRIISRYLEYDQLYIEQAGIKWFQFYLCGI